MFRILGLRVHFSIINEVCIKLLLSIVLPLYILTIHSAFIILTILVIDNN
jgi:hypothetical protein